MFKFSIRSLLALTLVAAMCVVFWIWSQQSYVIVKIPIAICDRHAAEEATALLSEFLQKTTGIDGNHKIVQNWCGRTQSVRVHVDKNGEIRSTCVGMEKYIDGPLAEWAATRVGLDGLEMSMFTEPRLGNELSVLITSDTDGWTGPEKQKVIDLLLEHFVQIYSVQQSKGVGSKNSSEGSGNEKTSQSE